MSTSATILETHPRKIAEDFRTVLAECLDACLDCSQACTQCADACLSEPAIDTLTACIAANLNCADICTATATINARQTGFDPELAKALIAVCATACRVCADECQRHSSHHQHCKICADECRKCEQACRALIEQFS
ncbi:Domain of Uncharacterised Function (DUF326) [Mycobacteroides abscessus subsp. massiliense]|uniref:four-helix bundle copper-binding protein n=1 Tax=Mycobacteroides abscessus TaxID=36809 RepID=UPI0009A7EC98|nr:four-helix bundle copper-binding protein [Mycobacteroides abscessus]SKK91999.1 Domain of Uncharacterised Function (DUF326) [Mycobacteroides abscessus subsp. massiliense]